MPDDGRVPYPSFEPRPELPDFEILGELGRGGMGIVYQARQRSADRLVALKVIRKDRLQHEDAVRRFRREAQAAQRVSHPNIVRLYGSDLAGDLHYLVMEFIDGTTLEKLVQVQGPQPIERACDFIRQAALGLQHALEQGLVHRDIKPSNLMVAPPPPPPHQDHPGSRYDRVVKILDMGVARVLQIPGQGESLSTLTQGGAVIGTADYIAPEQLEDPRLADIRADLYSLGCTFYFLLTGQVPFPGGSLIVKLDKQRWENPVSIHQLRQEVPAGLVQIVQKLMAKKPRDRFKSPAELVQALEELPRKGFASSTVQAAPPAGRILGNHEGPVDCLAVSPDGRRAASGGRDRQVRLWDLQTFRSIASFPALPQAPRALAFSPDASRLAAGTGLALRIWDLSSGLELHKLSGHSSAIRALLFVDHGRRLFSAGDDRTIRGWELHDGREVQRFVGHKGEVTGLASVGPDGPLVSVGRDQTLRVWDLRSGGEIRSIACGGKAILGVSLSPDGRFGLTAHFDTILRLWELDTGRELRRFLGHRQMVNAAAFLPDGTGFLSAGQDQTLRLWDLETGQERLFWTAEQGPLLALGIVPGSAPRALSAGTDGSLKLWDVPA